MYSGAIDSYEQEEDIGNNDFDEDTENHANCDEIGYNAVSQEYHEEVASRFARDSRSSTIHPIAFNFQETQPATVN